MNLRWARWGISQRRTCSNTDLLLVPSSDDKSLYQHRHHRHLFAQQMQYPDLVICSMQSRLWETATAATRQWILAVTQNTSWSLCLPTTSIARTWPLSSYQQRKAFFTISELTSPWIANSCPLKANIHYASWFEACRRSASNQPRTSFKPDSVMKFGREPASSC